MARIMRAADSVSFPASALTLRGVALKMQSSRWWRIFLITGLLLPATLWAQGQTLTGVVRSAAAPGAALVIEVPGQPEQLNLRAAGVVVMRDGLPAQLADLQPGDQVT